VTTLQASVFVVVVGGAGLLVLHSLTNPLAMWLTLATFLGYAIIYTIFLKRARRRTSSSAARRGRCRRFSAGAQ